MKLITALVSLLVASTITIAKDVYDYTTPERALSSIELAYKKRDIEQAVASKDFLYEAEEMLTSSLSSDLARGEILKNTAELLEMAYRKNIAENGFPDFASLKCSATHIKVSKDEALLNERCLYPDGGYSAQMILAHLTDSGWKIIGIRELD
jgi:hypothetical protein